MNVQNLLGTLAFRASTAPERFRHMTDMDIPSSGTMLIENRAHIVDRPAGFGGAMPLSGTLNAPWPTIVAPVLFGANAPNATSPSSAPTRIALSWGTGVARVYNSIFYQTYKTSKTTNFAFTTPLRSGTLSGASPTEMGGRISISLVSPMVTANTSFNEHPLGIAKLDLEFVPEPGPGLLMCVSALMLICISLHRRAKSEGASAE